MIRISGFILALLIHVSCFSQTILNWQETFGGPRTDLSSQIISTSDKGYLLVGNTFSHQGDVTFNHDTTGIHADMWVIKFDSTFQIEWERSFGGSMDETMGHAIETFDHGFAFCGYTNSKDGDVTMYYDTLGNSLDIWVVKLSSNGAIVWEKSLGGKKDDYASKIIQSPDSGLIVVGATMSIDGNVSFNNDSLGTSFDAWLVKLSKTGQLIWDRAYGGNSYPGEFGYDLHFVQGNSMLMTATATSNNGDLLNDGNHNASDDLWIVLLDSSGVIVADSCFGGSNKEYPSRALILSDSTFLIAANTFSNNGDVVGSSGTFSEDIWILSLGLSGDSSIVILKQNCFGNAGSSDIANDISSNDKGCFILVGQNTMNGGDVLGNHGQKDLWWLELDSNLLLTNKKSYGGTLNDVGNSLIRKGENSFLIAGSSESNNGNVAGNNGMLDVWILELGIFTGMSNSTSTQLDQIRIYPNPGSGIFNIENAAQFSDSPETVSFEIFDLSGRIIFQKNERLDLSLLQLDLSSLASGMYFLRMNSNGATFSSKIVKQ